MSLPRKKTRRIVVDGEVYRWLRKGSFGRYLGDSYHWVRVTVQKDDEPGLLQFTLRAKEDCYVDDGGGDIIMLTGVSVTPKMIATVIKKAVEWDPSKKGVYKFSDSLDLGDYEIKE